MDKLRKKFSVNIEYWKGKTQSEFVKYASSKGITEDKAKTFFKEKIKVEKVEKDK